MEMENPELASASEISCSCSRGSPLILDDRAIQLILKEVDTKEAGPDRIPTAASEELKDKIFRKRLGSCRDP